MTAISTGVPEIILTDVTGSQVGTKSNPFFVSSSNPPQTVNVNNVNNVYIFNGGEFLASASYVLTSSNEYFPNAGVHQLLQEAIHLTDDGGPRGALWPNNMFNESGPLPFITASVWWDSALRTKKIVEQLITRNGNQTPSTIQWKVYASDGLSVVESYTDTITYEGMFESSRIRSRP